jgi:hypothetical protein
MKTLICIVLLALSSVAYAEDQYAAKSKFAAEVLLSAAVNAPDKLKIDSTTVYRRPGPFGNVCGTMRGQNAYGAEIRANFVVSDSPTMPVYIGPIPLNVFKNYCSGEEVK